MILSILKKKFTQFMRPGLDTDEKMHPSGTDIGLRHRFADAGIHIRDDGVVEINSGKASITLDGKSGIVFIGGKKVATSTSELINHAEKYIFGTCELNRDWMPAKEALTPATDSALETEILTVLPGSLSPVPVPFSSLVAKKPIFKKRNTLKIVQSALELALKGMK